MKKYTPYNCWQCKFRTYVDVEERQWTGWAFIQSHFECSYPDKPFKLEHEMGCCNKLEKGTPICRETRPELDKEIPF